VRKGVHRRWRFAG